MPNLEGTMPDPKNRQRVARQRTIHDPATRKGAEKKKLPAPGWISWWPVAVGLVLGLLGPQLRDLLAPYAPWSMRLVYPFVLLASHKEMGLSDELALMLPQAMLFAQFPLEGLAVKFMLGRGVKVSAAIGQMVTVHMVCTLVLWLVAGAAA
ncbi:MAG: hypothetical protein P4K97_07320 [Terracidiphilus sp.]|nr:hypothetical protein [Terracidiphilus sp.]